MRARTSELFAFTMRAVSERADRLFAVLLVFEWFAAVLIASVISPGAWGGSAHARVPTALVLGGLIVSLPVWCALRRAGRVSTRHVVALAQMAMGALLIYLTGGRIETHFFCFGSLAFLSFYRDWRVMLTATALVVVYHFVAGLVWPEWIYGVAVPTVWRSIEHMGWLAFEDAYLVVSCVQGQKEMRKIAERYSLLESERDARCSRDAAESANVAKSAFLANMSHEIRTPMTAILGFSDMLLDTNLSVSERLNHVQIIQRNSRHLLALIDGILDLSKIEAGKMSIEAIPCSPSRIVAEVVSLLRGRAASKGLSLEVTYRTPIPAQITSDPTRVRQILMNVLANAIKFTGKGGIHVAVSCVDPGSDAPLLSFVVKDTGIGIAKEKIASLLEPFTQADTSTTRKYGGSGLGLAISKRLVAMLGGNLSVESTIGKGSVFSFTLATGSLSGSAMLTDPDGTEPAPRSSVSSTPPLAGCRVLLAEDGPDNQLLIATHLKRAGATVTFAENGRIAVDKAMSAAASGKPFDIVLMDMQMPVLDGYAATEELRARSYKGPIIAVTAHAMTGDRQLCERAGCDDYLTKPIVRAALISTVQARSGFAPRDSAPALTMRAADVQRCSPVPRLSSTPRLPSVLVSELAGDAEMSDILHGFVRGLPAQMQDLRDAAERCDWTLVRRFAHQLRGAAGGYGFGVITEVAGRLERAASDPAASTSTVRPDVDALIDLCHRARASVPPPVSSLSRSA